MQYVTDKYKRRFVHRNDPPDIISKVKCGAWTYGGQYDMVSGKEVVPAKDVKRYHQCRKCFPIT